ncbi:MAG: cell surface protein SprA [Bacteroidetes bacterium]|nr:MAG: cell surface protein SprA [Bacteroidota bacterium]
MKQIAKYSLTVIAVLCLFVFGDKRGVKSFSSPTKPSGFYIPTVEDSLAKDSISTDNTEESETDSSISLPFPFEDNGNTSPTGGSGSPLYLSKPSNIQTTTEYDPETNQYNTTQTIGSEDYRNPTYMTFEEYQDYDMDKALQEYWQNKSESESFERQRAVIPKLNIASKIVDRIFGGSTVDIRPQGSAELTFAIKTNKTDNPALPEKSRKNTTFDFDEKIQMSVTGSIGDKLSLTTNYNTEATFDFENKMKLEYTGDEDEIIKKIEAGNVALPLSGTLITGSQTLFGIKTQLQFGKLMVTGVFSQEKGKKSEIDVKGGAQTFEYNVRADQYEENKHFFLAQYFHDNYEPALRNLPLVNSGINITKIEVWVTSRLGQTKNIRSIAAFMDLGEQDFFDTSDFVNPGPFSLVPNADPFDTNYLKATNTLYQLLKDQYPTIRDLSKINSTLFSTGLVLGQDYEKVESARMLSASEFKFNSQLGFISLNSGLTNDEVLAVAFQFTFNGQTYQVGEFSKGGIDEPNALIVKLLKSTQINTSLPTWDLMMKNVYAIGSYNVQQDGFLLNILYKDPEVGVPANYLKEGHAEFVKGVPLLRVFNLDNLNVQLTKQPDGVFDFINGITINTSNGRIYFPVLEPFGQYLHDKITGEADGVYDKKLEPIADKYTFHELYDLTRSDAQQEHPEKNRFSLDGKYQSSSSSEISLNAMNVPPGSVTVAAGGQKLTENVHYTVDYSLGRVKIIDEGILNSGTPIKISFESNTLFNIQSKTLMGARLDYRVSKDLNIGGTVLHLTERPITQKINIGDEPISNTIWGLDADYRTDVPLLTKMVDLLPVINTKAPSTVTVSGEFAHLIPGHSKAVGKEGISYIDDFEGSRSTIDLKSFSSWALASTPLGATGPGGNELFPEAAFSDSLPYGYKRSKLAWYIIDPLFSYDNNLTPDHIKGNAIQSNDYMRSIIETELFPNKELSNQQLQNLPVFDLAYYPSERGPYNYDPVNVESNGDLSFPETRWGGIMRSINTNDFEAANIEFIEFWMMDPFHLSQGIGNDGSGGDLYLNLGSISEDVLKDGKKSYENGLPTSSLVVDVETTAFGRVPSKPPVVDAFANSKDSRLFQDVGMDGLSDADEADFFATYLNQLKGIVSSAAYDKAAADPSSDNYNYFRDDDFDAKSTNILERYRMYNGHEGNSPTTEIYETQNSDKYPTSSTTLPNKEDINRDVTLDEKESYFQYRISLRPQDMIVGQNHITDVVTGTGQKKDGTAINVKWYQFKVPIKNPERVVGTIQDFKSIRFMRMFFHNFSDTIVCRLAKFGLVRSEWRKYECVDNNDCLDPGEYLNDDDFDETTFDVSVVNIEENGSRTPVPYAIPPDIVREQNVQTADLVALNEQALSLKVCGLEDGHSRSAYKITDFDFRSYKKLKMFVHAEDASPGGDELSHGDLRIFIRLGSDFTDNYYEYEIPLRLTPWGTSVENKEAIWPEINEFNFEFSALHEVKQARNVANWSINVRYPESGSPHGPNLIYVKGTPDLSKLKTMMIGIRNPKKIVAGGTDDGLDKCAEIWVNELRLAGFDEKSGWAATARMTAKLADFAIVNLSGGVRTPGFGSIEKKVSERDRETTLQYDVSSTMQLGQFIPDKIGLKIPMYVGYSETLKKPQYNPLDGDILMKDALEEYDPNGQDSLKKLVRDLTKRKSINFTNVKKVRGKGSGKSQFYDIENIALTYAYTEDYHEDINVEFSSLRNHHGSLSYNFSNKPKNYKPFAKVKSLRKNKYLRLVKDFNFYLAPSRLSFRTNMDRRFGESKLRNLSGYDLIIDTLFAKQWTWDRMYNIKYDISKALKFNFKATNLAFIDEPDGRLDTETKKDSVKGNLGDLGRTTDYKHSANLSFTVPLNKFPLTNWLSTTLKYGSTYSWMSGPYDLTDGRNDTLDLGHTIKNSNTRQLNGQANMVTLYNKVKYLKRINAKYNKRKRQKVKQPEYKEVKFEKDGVKFVARKPKGIFHELNTKDITSVEVFDKNGKKIKGKLFITNKNKITYELKVDLKDAKIVIKAKKKRGMDLERILELTALTLMSTKKISVTYSENNGTIIPGYLRRTQYIGQDWSTGTNAPGMDFLFGYQPDTAWVTNAARNGWLSKSASQYMSYQQTKTKNLSIKATLEPIANLRVDITMNRNETRRYSEVFRDSTGTGDFFVHQSPVESGNFSISFFSLGTMFEKDNKEYESETFKEFKTNRTKVSGELREEYARRNPSVSDPNQVTGFNETSQEVMLPAFLEAYGGVDSKKTIFDPFIKMPKPNWRANYDGLTKIPFFSRYFKKITIGHGYRSSYSVSSFTTNRKYDEGGGADYTTIVDANENLLPRYEIDQVTISEQLSPLIKIDMTWKNSLLTRFEWKKTRNITLSFSNNQLTEVRGDEYIVGLGYRFKDVKLPFKIGKKKKKMQSDVNVKADFSVRSNTTIIRRLVEETNDPLKGQQITSINVTADYKINQRFTMQAFYKRNGNKPFVSNLFKTSNSSFGITIRFTLAP